MTRQTTKRVATLVAVAALVGWAGARPAQAQQGRGPYDHDGGRYYADEARDYARLGYDVPLSRYAGYVRPIFVYPSAPRRYYGGDPYAAAPNYSYGAYAPAADNAARIQVVVPADAQVWFDGKATKMSGARRQFESPALTPGRQYTYDVKARWRGADGKEVTQTRHVDVAANSDVTVDFTRAGQ
jgi:uncharacterized protein (TIGR03000 family)